jgi:hypothetical protein
LVNFPQTPNDLIELMKDNERRKKLTEDDWLDIGNWMKENIKKDKVSEDVYRKFWPLGIGEVIATICDGIHYRRKTGRYAK